MRLSVGMVCLAVVASACTPPEPMRPLIINRKSFDFGTVELGVTARLTVAVTNPNDRSVSLSTFALANVPAEVTLTGTTEPLEPNERRMFTVAWQPATEQTVDGTLDIEASDGAGRRSLPVTAVSGTLGADLDLHGAASCGPANSLALGEVTWGAAVTRVITLTSTGTAPIRVLRSVLPTPEIGLAVTGPFGTPIAPGASADFTLTWDPLAIGNQVRDVKLLTDSVLHPEVVISMCGTGHAPLLCVTPTSLGFGTISVGSRDTRTLALTSCGDLPVTVSSLVSTPMGGITISPRTPAPTTLDPSQSLAVDVSFAPLNAGVVRTSLIVTSTSAIDPVVEIEISGNQPPPCSLSLSTTHLDLFAFSPRGVVTMTNSGTNDCVLQRLEIVPAGPFAFDRTITPPVVVAAHSSLGFEVVYTPSTASNAVDRATVELEFDRVSKVALTGTSAPPAGCRLVPNFQAVDFGLLPPGSPGQFTLQLTNVGANACHLVNVSSTLPAVTINYMSSTIDPQAVLRLNLGWDPMHSNGQLQGSLTIQSDDLVNPSLTLPLAGGHIVCDPNCTCGANEQLASWRFTPGWPASSVEEGTTGQSAYRHSCEPARCQNQDILFEVQKGILECVAPALDCVNGQQPDYVAGHWRCTNCDMIIQFGSLYDGLRVCAPKPMLSCPSSESPTFDAAEHDWKCVPTCNNGLYDQRTAGGLLVCVPC